MKTHVQVPAPASSISPPARISIEFYLSLECDHCDVKPEIKNGTGKFELVGGEGNVQRYRVKAELNDDIDLSEYPFDEHALSIEIQDAEKEADELIFEPADGGASISPDVKIPGFTVEGASATVETTAGGKGENFSDFSAEIDIKRIAFASIMKGMLPVWFMVIVALSALALRAKSAANRLAMATSALLSAVMFHVSSTSALPPIGYVTRTDKFMIATYLVLLVNIVTCVQILRLDDKKDEKGVARVHNLSAVLVPLLAIGAYAVVLLKVV